MGVHKEISKILPPPPPPPYCVHTKWMPPNLNNVNSEGEENLHNISECVSDISSADDEEFHGFLSVSLVSSPDEGQVDFDVKKKRKKKKRKIKKKKKNTSTFPAGFSVDDWVDGYFPLEPILPEFSKVPGFNFELPADDIDDVEYYFF